MGRHGNMRAFCSVIMKEKLSCRGLAQAMKCGCMTMNLQAKMCYMDADLQMMK
jgi:hypothetical protein